MDRPRTPNWLPLTSGLFVLLLLLTAMTARCDTTTFDCGPLRLGFDSATGQWTYLALAAAESPGQSANLLDGATTADIGANVAGGDWPAPGAWKTRGTKMTRTAAGFTVTVDRAASDWQVSEVYEVDAHAPVLSRSATLHYIGKAKVRLWGTSLLVPGVSLGSAAGAVWCLPGNFPVRELRLSENVPGREVRETGWTWSDTGVAYVRSAASRIAVIVNYYFEIDKASVKVDEAAGAVSLVHDFGTVADLAPGDSIEIGRQMVEVAEGGQARFRAAAQDLAARANPASPPPDRPRWLAGAVIEEAHPWGRLESWSAGDRGDRMPDLTAQLPYLHKLGVDAIWVMPVSNKPPWVYSLPAFGRLDPEVTTAAQLKDLVATAHRLGLHALLDLVLHGLSPASPDVATLPESAWCHDEKGERVKSWGGAFYASDPSDPAWQAASVRRVTHWVGDFGFDGFRLDCAGLGQALNWRPTTGLRANRSTEYGGVTDDALVRKTIRAINPDAATLLEGGTPLLLRCGDIIHDYPLYMVMREMTHDPSTAHWVGELCRWLAAQQLTFAPAMMPGLLRFTKNHDTVAAREFFGVGPSQALTALCTFLPGTLLLYQEQEIGYSTDLAEWLRLRHDLPELKTGAADYEAVQASDPDVLAFLRTSSDGDASIVAINFSGREAKCRLTVAASLLKKLPVAQEAMATAEGSAGARVDLAKPVTIPPWRPVVITLRATPMAAVAQVPEAAATGTPAAAAGKLVLETTTAQLSAADARREEGGQVPATGPAITRTTLRLAPVVRWFVRTPEGLLEDRFIDRHRKHKPGETAVDATPPLARAWRPVESGLWDTPGERALGAIAEDGRWVEVVVINEAAVRRARIEDPSSVGREVSLVVDHDAGTTPFRVVEGRMRASDLRAGAGDDVDTGPLAPVVQAAPLSLPGGVTVEVGPLFVRARNAHYEVDFARRHGGTIYGLRRPGDSPDIVSGGSEIYTDWGLYKKGTHISTQCETSPRLHIATEGGAALITFRGLLHGPSWNGVQSGGVPSPRAAYRITYRVDASPDLGVTYGLTPSADWKDVSAFFAYRLAFGPVEEWRVDAAGHETSGKPTEKPAEIIYQATPEALAGLAMHLKLAGGDVTIRKLSGNPQPPDKPFLFDSGRGTIHLFATILDGTKTTLPAGKERRASFELVLR